jgi:MFS family permease
LAGGVFAGVIGPQRVVFTKDAWPAYLFAGTYLAQSACALFAAIVLVFPRIPKLPAVRTFAAGRPLSDAPSFFTGALILRFGLRGMMTAGLALIAAAAAIGYAGIGLWNFWLSLIVLGVGWNFAFIGATTLVTECHSPEERNKVQAVNDFLIFGSMAVASLSTGALLARYGWTAVTELVFPVFIAAAVLLAWGTFTRRTEPA